MRNRVTSWMKNALLRARHNSKVRGHEIRFTLSDVEALWMKQRGRCYWTGVPMVPSVEKRDPQRPSLDRLDNAIGYVPGNVVLATAFANIGRQTASSMRFADFLLTLRLSMMASALVVA